MIDADDLDRLYELAEDMADIRAAEEARAEMKATGEAPIPWDEVGRRRRDGAVTWHGRSAGFHRFQ